jgi:Lon protease-like protein
VPLNIFEPRYVDMINDSMKSNKLVGMIQPKLLKNKDNEIPQLHEIGCMGKITSFKETEETRYLIELKGIIRFKVINEIDTNKRYRECKIDFENYYEDLENKKENIKFSDLELIFKDLKSLFERRGFIINWKALEKQSLNETINALAMASPFSIEEKQVLLEAKNLDIRKTKIAEILTTYSFDQYNNTTIQ